MAMILDLSSLAKALDRLDEALQALAKAPGNDLYTDATIQRFEFCYELSHKMLRRFLELSAASPQSIDEMPFPDLIRTGCEQSLLRSGWDRWQAYRKARGTTSHTYDWAKAQEVLALVPDFLLEARHLLTALRHRTQAP